MILKDIRGVFGASLQDLRETYAALTNTPLPAHMSIAAARTRVEMCMLANVKAQQVRGVPPNSVQKPVPVAALIEKHGAANITLAEVNPYAEGTLLRELHDEAAAAPVIERRPLPVKAADKAGGHHAPLGRRTGYVFSAGGTSKMQPGSSRSMVLRFVKAAFPESVTIEAVAAHCAALPGYTGEARQHLQKLLAVGHVTVSQLKEPT